MDVLSRLRLKTGVGSYPYVNTRIRAMKAKLLDESDYRKLKQMERKAVTEFLQKTPYKEDINKFMEEYSGSAFLDKVLKSHLETVYSKLQAIAPDELKTVLDLHLSNTTADAVKTILRAKERGVAFETAIEKVGFAPCISEGVLRSIYEAEEWQDVVSLVPFPDEVESDLPICETLWEKETYIDERCYEGRLRRYRALLKPSGSLERFMEESMRIKNILTVLRLKQRSASKEDMRASLLGNGSRTKIIDDMIATETVSDAIKLLSDEKVGEYIDSEDIEEVEQSLERYRLQQGLKLLHSEQLSEAPLIGFIVAKQAEIRNLRIIAEALVAGRDTAFIEDNIMEEVA